MLACWRYRESTLNMRFEWRLYPQKQPCVWARRSSEENGRTNSHVDWQRIDRNSYSFEWFWSSRASFRRINAALKTLLFQLRHHVIYIMASVFPSTGWKVKVLGIIIGHNWDYRLVFKLLSGCLHLEKVRHFISHDVETSIGGESMHCYLWGYQSTEWTWMKDPRTCKV